MARPKKEFDKTQFEKLCAMQASEREVCDWFGTTDKTLDAWCKRTYHAGYSEVAEQKRGVGRISIRRMQFKLAETSAAMAIFLGKNYLGQSDTGPVGKATEKDNNLAEIVKVSAEDVCLNDIPELEQAPAAGDNVVEPAEPKDG